MQQTVLVVDDDSQVRTALSRLLGRIGYDTREAGSVREALTRIAHEKIDVVLCDLVMPEFSGHALLEQLSLVHRPPPFVLMSGQAAATDVARAFGGGASDVLFKPFTRLQLADALERAAGRVAPPHLPPARVAALVYDLHPEEVAGPAPRPSLNRINSWPRVVEILRRAVKGRRGRLLLDDRDGEAEVELSALTCHSGRGYSGALAIEVARIGNADFADMQWYAHQGCVVWFTDDDGIYGFRSTVVSGNRGRLVLTQPDCVVKYSRRRCARVEVPPDFMPHVVLPLADGSTFEAEDAVLDISASGMALALPSGMSAPIGALLSLALAIQAGGRLLRVAAPVRRCSPGRDGTTVLGLEFEGLTPSVRINLVRFAERLALQSARLDFVATPTSLPDLDQAELRLQAGVPTRAR